MTKQKPKSVPVKDDGFYDWSKELTRHIWDRVSDEQNNIARAEGAIDAYKDILEYIKPDGK